MQVTKNKIVTTKLFIAAVMSIILSSCFGGKPFRPPAPEYTQWAKDGLTDQDVMQAMKECGYKDLYGYGDKTPNNEAAKQESCMFMKGFKRKGHYKGICSLEKQKSLPACKENQKNN